MFLKLQLKKCIKSLLSKVINLVFVVSKPLTTSLFWKERTELCLFLRVLAKFSCDESSAAVVPREGHWVKGKSQMQFSCRGWEFSSVWLPESVRAAGCSVWSTVLHRAS